MTKAKRSWLATILIGTVCLLALAGLAFYRLRAIFTLSDFLARLPTQDATVAYFDLRVLRQSPLFAALTRRDVAQEPEYKTFVERTGFDYTKDLDYVLVSYHPDGMFAFAGGRFDWQKLNAYAQREGGSCYNMFCRMQGSLPTRQISFFALRHNTIALGVGRDSWAAGRLTVKMQDTFSPDVPSRPVWVSFPAGQLRQSTLLPEALGGLGAALADAGRVTISAGVKGDGLEAVVGVNCRSEQEAEKLRAQLQTFARSLPGAADVRAALAAGTFVVKKNRLEGSWPLSRPLVEKLIGGA